MKFFKHFSNNSTHNETMTRLLADLGMESYGRYWVLVEHLIEPIDDLASTPHATHSDLIWAKILHLKSKNVQTFLKYLEDILLIKLERFGDQTTVTLLNSSKLLARDAVSSQCRTTSGRARREKEENKNNSFSKNQKSNSPVGSCGNETPSNPVGSEESLPLPLKFVQDDGVTDLMKAI